MEVFYEDIFSPTCHSDNTVLLSGLFNYMQYKAKPNSKRTKSIIQTNGYKSILKQAECSAVSWKNPKHFRTFCSCGMEFSEGITVWERASVLAAVSLRHGSEVKVKYDEIHFSWHNRAPRCCHMLPLSLLRKPLQSSICHSLSLSFSSCILPGQTKGGLRNAAPAKC